MRIGLALILGAVAVLAGPGAGETRELLTNGSLEEGPEGWELVHCEIVREKERNQKERNLVLMGDKSWFAFRGAGTLDGSSGSDLDSLLGETLEFDRGPKPEAKSPRTSRLSRSVQLTAGNRYTLRFQARGRGSDVAIHALLRGPDGRTREQLTMRRSIGSKWVKVERNFTVDTTGKTAIDIELAAVPGSGTAAWVDDFSLIETVMPPQFPITEGRGFNSDPVTAAGPDDSVYCAVISFVEGKDVIRLFRVADVSAKAPRAERFAELTLPGCRDVWRLAMASAGSEAWLAASCEVSGNWDIYLWRIGPGGVGEAIRVTDNPATDTNPSIAVLRDRLAVAWETNRGRHRQIMVTHVTEGETAEPKTVSSADSPSYYPAIAADHDGNTAWLVWESFRAGNYDIYGATYAGGQWGAERLLSSDPRIEHRPVVAFAPDGNVWMAWEAMEYLYQRYRTGRAAQQRILVASIDSDGLRTPQDVFDVFDDFSTFPSIACDADGRVWVCAQTTPRGSRRPVLRAFHGSGWADCELSAAPLLTVHRAQPCPLTVSGGRVLMGIAHERGRPNHYYGKPFASERHEPHEMNVRMVGLDLADMPPPSSPELVPLDLPGTEFDMVAQRQGYGEDLTGKTIEYNGETLHLLWGQFHEHSDISQCVRGLDLSAQDSYGYHRDIHKEDFCAVTDHGYNMSEVIWRYLSKTARAQHDPGRFTTFLGLEWTAQWGNGGHRNLIFGDTRFPRWFNAKDGSKPTDIWAELKKMDANFICIPHQLADTGLSVVDWSYSDEVLQPLAEIFQLRGSYEHRGCPRQAGSSPGGDGHFLQDAWAQGVVIGVVASPDHGGGLGKAAVYAPENTREAILDACRKRHTYGTTAAKIFLDIRVNGHLMGEKIEARGKPVRIRVDVAGTAPLQKVQICRSNKFIYTLECDTPTCTFEWEDPDPLPGTSYYYVRVLQQSVQLPSETAVPEIAWSSPVWVDR